MTQQPELFPSPSPERAVGPVGAQVTGSSTLLELLPAFLDHLRERSLAANTVRCLANDVELLARHLGEDTPVSKCSTARLRQYLAHLDHEEGLSAKSLQRRTTTLKTLFGWLEGIGAISVDPAAALEQTPSPVRLPQVLTPAERDRLTTAARELLQGSDADARPYLLVALLLSTGMTKTELLNLGLDDFYLDDMPAVVIQPATRGDHPRYLRLPDDLPAVVNAYLRQYHPRKRLFECTGRNLEYVLDDLRKRAGIRRRVGFRVLRWTSAVDSLRAGMDPETLRTRLGLAEATWASRLPLLEQLSSGPN